jgi:hypothetical protein
LTGLVLVLGPALVRGSAPVLVQESALVLVQESALALVQESALALVQESALALGQELGPERTQSRHSNPNHSSRYRFRRKQRQTLRQSKPNRSCTCCRWRR